MMHHGSYDKEPETFSKMEKYCEEQGLIRIEKAIEKSILQMQEEQLQKN